MSFVNPLSPIRLSKSKFLSGLQCLKRLYLEIHMPELASKVDPVRKAIMEMGTEVGVMARKRFPQGILVQESYRQTSAALRRTSDLVQDPSTHAIFEGAFEWQGTLVRVDVLERVDTHSWKLIEVKSTAKVKAIHIHDLAVQAQVLLGAGIQLAGMSLMHLNTRYLYEGGPLDLESLFVVADVTESVHEQSSQVAVQLTEMRRILSEPVPPTIQADSHCHLPYECQFWGNCTKEKPPRWVYALPGKRQTFYDLQAKGIDTIDAIPDDFQLTILQQRMKDNVEWMSEDFSTILRTVEYPIHHLDFEMFMPAIPPYPGTRPYRPIPIQWSNHIEYEDGTIQHESYLCTDPKDPREEIAHSVLATVRQSGTICVYSENERHILLSLGDSVPSLKRSLVAVVGRLWDLFEVLQNHYYHPGFAGSFSFKTVLPALVPSLSYDNLDVQNGAMASVIYRKMVFEEPDLIERSKMATAMLEYCARDTLGMLNLRHVLLEKSKPSVMNTKL